MFLLAIKNTILIAVISKSPNFVKLFWGRYWNDIDLFSRDIYISSILYISIKIYNMATLFINIMYF